MVADVIDYERYRTGRYMPGTISSIFSFIENLVSAFNTVITSLCLAAIGFHAVVPTTDTPYSAAFLWLGLLFQFGFPFIGWLVTFIAMRFYELDGKKMAEIREYNELHNSEGSMK